MTDALLRTAEVSARLKVSRDTVLKLVEEGRLRATRIGPKTIRIFESSVTELIKTGLN